MSNWRERLSSAFAARSAAESEEARKRLNAEIARKDSEDRGRKLRKERLDTFRSKVDPVLAKSALAEARGVWRVGNISEKIPDEENLDWGFEWVFKLIFSRRGKASYCAGSMAYGNSFFRCNGRWTDSLAVTFKQHWDDHDVYVEFSDGHYFNPDNPYDRNTGHDHRDAGKDEEWWRSGNIRTLLVDGSMIENVILELCEQRILNKQLPLDYKY